MSAHSYLPLQCQQLSLTLGNNRCLSDINFTIDNRGISVVMGANGSGKTLLLKSCAGLMPPTHGQIRWQTSPSPPQLTWVPQQAVMLNRSVADNLLLPLKHQRISDKTERCREALAWVGIGHLSEQPAHTLSTGEQQLVALARAWALSPSILILDEPSANLDPTRQQQIDPLIEALSKHCKIILSTHSIRQARELATDILLLEHGKLVVHTSADIFFNSNEFKRFQGYV